MFCGGRYSIISRCIGQQPLLECFAGQASLLFGTQSCVAKDDIAGHTRLDISSSNAAPDQTRSLSQAASRRCVKSVGLRCHYRGVKGRSRAWQA